MAEQKLLVKREGDFHYPIYFEKDFSFLSQAVAAEGLQDRKVCIVTDSHVEPLYYTAVETELKKVSSCVFSYKIIPATIPVFSLSRFFTYANI